MTSQQPHTASVHLSRFLIARRTPILAIVLLLSAASFIIACQLTLNTDFLSMLNSNEPAVQDYRYVQEQFSQMDSFVLYFAKAKQDAVQIETLTRQIQTLPAVISVRRVGADSGMLSSLLGASMPYALVFVKPSFPPTNMAESRRLSKQIQTMIEQQNLKPQITGSYQVFVESSDSIARDMSLTSIITFAGLFILLFGVMRMGIWPVLAAMLSLTVGMGFTLAITYYTLGRLNLLTAALPSVILGLGIDFSLHILYAFREQIVKDPRNAANWQSHFESFFAVSFRPLLIGAITTAAAFLSLYLASTPAVREMGLFGAVGILCTFLTSVLILPLLLSFLPSRFLTRIQRTEKLWVALYTILLPYRRAVLGITAACLIGSGLLVLRVQFSSDQNRLSDQNIPSLALQNTLFSQYHIFPVPVVFISPDAEIEQKKALWIQQHGFDLFAMIQGYSTALITGQSAQEFVGKDHHYLTLAYPKDNIFDPAVINGIHDFCGQLQKAFPEQGNRIASTALIQDSLTQSIKIDLAACSMTAGLIVVGMIYGGLRRISKTLLALIPMVFAIWITIGLMGLFGLDFNMITVVIVPLIIGTGIDNGVHFLCKLDISKNTLSALSVIASPITGTSLTSILAFASLLFCKNIGFKELGIVGISGFGFCLVFSLLVLPLLTGRK